MTNEKKLLTEDKLLEIERFNKNEYRKFRKQINLSKTFEQEEGILISKVLQYGFKRKELDWFVENSYLRCEKFRNKIYYCKEDVIKLLDSNPLKGK